MKNVFGSLIILLVLSVTAFASETPETPYLNTDNECSVPMGVIAAKFQYYASGQGWVYADAQVFVLGSHPSGGYYARMFYTTAKNYGNFRCFYNESLGNYEVQSTSYVEISACQQQYYEYVQNADNSLLSDPQALYDDYFGADEPESRLPWDDDLDADGRPDRYDMDCPHYIDYLEYCRENDLDALDLRDYQYWYEHGLDEYLAARDQYYDSDLDGFSDGYEIIHNTDMNDASSYPLGRPDMGTANQIMGGVDSPEPWRYEEYADGWSRGHVYDMGYDPFGDTPIEEINADFVGPPDWYGLDSSGDGINNGAKLELGQDPYEFNFQQGSHYVYDDAGGYWKYVGGVTDADFPFPDPPTLEEALAKYEDYMPDGSGNYTYNPGTFEFGDAEYDARLQKFQKIRFDVDSVRPVQERDYQVHFNIPIPGNSETYTIAVVPDTSSPGGAAVDNLRRIIRALSAVVISYVFVKHVWTVIRQY
jgi:hypothetical protein